MNETNPQLTSMPASSEALNLESHQALLPRKSSQPTLLNKALNFPQALKQSLSKRHVHRDVSAHGPDN